MPLSIIRFPADCLSDFSRRFGRKRIWLTFGGLQPEAAGTALAERLFKFGKNGLEFARQRPRRIDDQQPRRNKTGLGGLRRAAEFTAKAFSRRSPAPPR